MIGTTFNLIRFNKNGDTSIKLKHWAPILTYYPNPQHFRFLKTFTVNTTHDMHNSYAQYTLDINFNDSLFMLVLLFK
jgi:hypothetical protein